MQKRFNHKPFTFNQGRQYWQSILLLASKIKEDTTKNIAHLAVYLMHRLVMYRRGRMVAGFTTTYSIGANHH
jgi:CRISPR/Cas system CSM-associated protein Csm2 small subunit